MKKFSLVIFLMLTAQALAGPDRVILQCATPRGALDGAQLVETNDGKTMLKISYVNDTEESFILTTSLKNIKKGDSDTLIAAKNPDMSFGGGIADAALLRVFPGQRGARLAANGKVYILSCSKP